MFKGEEMRDKNTENRDTENGFPFSLLRFPFSVNRVSVLCVSVFLFSVIFSFQSHAVSAADLPRKILAFYDPQMFTDPFYSPAHQRAAMPLNHLGMEVVYRSVSDPFPAEEEMRGFRGVLSWFERRSAVPHPPQYCRWLEDQIKKGRKVVLLGEMGIFRDKKRKMIPQCRRAFQALGARYFGDFSDTPLFFKVVQKEAGMVEFERRLNMVEGLLYSRIRVMAPQSHVYLKMERTDMEESGSDLVWTTPQGGFAHNGYVRYENKDLDKFHWRIHPFRFFEEAFGLKGWPRPDTTTVNGRRIFYTHIDGDGIVNVSHIDWKSFSGEMIHEEILKKHPHLPITASIIAGYLDMREYRSERVMKLYRDIFSLPNVETGSHGYAHPLVWSKGTLALKIPGAVYNDTKEVEGSTGMINRLLEQLQVGKKAGIFLWTGDCILSEANLSKAYRIGVLNINGGDTRFDKRYDSYGFVGPTGIFRGPHLQVYAGASNENVYTNLWEGPYYGFIDVLQTFEKTESPIRVKPINVYYHFYSGERHAALKALKTVYRKTLSEKIFPMFASDFTRIAADFYKTRLMPLSGGGFRVQGNGHLRTIRFDGEGRDVDMKLSRGVLGFRHFQNSLYVALDEKSEHDIYPGYSKNGPYVEEASFAVEQFRGDARHLSFFKKGWFASEAVLAGLLPRRSYAVRAAGERQTVRTDAQGRLVLYFPSAENGGSAVKVEIIAR